MTGSKPPPGAASLNESNAGESNAGEFYAQTYDASVPDWPGEIDFYRALAAPLRASGGKLLEVACGTGRVAIRLARDGIAVVGLDVSAAMIEVAAEKSADLRSARWIVADMRTFELSERFDLAIIPGHSFQHLNNPGDQVACLECIKRHLNPGGSLVVHLDHVNVENVRWLADLTGDRRGVFEAAEVVPHPLSGNQVRASRAWWFEPATQSATVQTVWEELDADGHGLSRVEKAPVRLHCVFRFEMEHLLARTGFEVEAVYGDFFKHELQDDSPDMVWVARKPALSASRVAGR
jgi:SAM-dependent methyltransferase